MCKYGKSLKMAFIMGTLLEHEQQSQNTLYTKIKQILTQKNFPPGNCYSLIWNRMFAQLINITLESAKPQQTLLRGKKLSFMLPPSYHYLQVPLLIPPHLSPPLMPGVGLNDKYVIHFLSMDKR